jgi:hypothetical protein
MTWSDWLRSVVRTVLPGAWAAFVLWLASLGLPQSFTDWLASDTVATHVLELAAFAVVYGFVRFIEPHLPDWLTRLFLGSAKAPTYVKPLHAAD